MTRPKALRRRTQAERRPPPRRSGKLRRRAVLGDREARFPQSILARRLPIASCPFRSLPKYAERARACRETCRRANRGTIRQLAGAEDRCIVVELHVFREERCD